MALLGLARRHHHALPKVRHTARALPLHVVETGIPQDRPERFWAPLAVVACPGARTRAAKW